jgi:hypothetical protein
MLAQGAVTPRHLVAQLRIVLVLVLVLELNSFNRQGAESAKFFNHKERKAGQSIFTEGNGGNKEWKKPLTILRKPAIWSASVPLPICHLPSSLRKDVSDHATCHLSPVIISSGKITSSGKVFQENNNGAKYRIFISPRIMVLQSRK